MNKWQKVKWQKSSESSDDAWGNCADWVPSCRLIWESDPLAHPSPSSSSLLLSQSFSKPCQNHPPLSRKITKMRFSRDIHNLLALLFISYSRVSTLCLSCGVWSLICSWKDQREAVIDTLGGRMGAGLFH
nr:hypothetical protein Iba_chr10fCG6980 [Ipomoea batatas]